MHGMIREYRFMISRRTVQIALLFLLYAGNAYGWTLFVGNLSSSKIADRLVLADPFAVLQIFAAGALVSSEAVVGAFIVLLFFLIVGGRSFCSWVCPVNLVADLADWLRKSLRIDGGGSELRVSRHVRYWAIGLTIGLSLLLGVAAFESISPIAMLHRGIIFGMGLGWTAVLAVFLFDLLVVKNGFCGHLCPLGGFYALLGRYSLVRVAHDKEKCTLCMRCFDICPEPQVLETVGKQSGYIQSGECNNCGRCAEVCDEEAMGFGIRFPSAIT